MFKNYLATALNNLVKHKLYSAINVVGLAIGLAACIVIALYVREETSYDKQWDNADRIYRMNITFSIPGGEPIKLPYNPLPAMPAVAQYFAGDVENFSRTFGANRTIEIGEQEFEENIVTVDPGLLDIFRFELLDGSFEDTFANPTNVAITDEVAARFFGGADPIGQVISVATPVGPQRIINDYQVTAVYRLPGNTVLDIPMFSLLNEAVLPPALKNWFNAPAQSYMRVRDGFDMAELERQIPTLIDQNVDISAVFPGAEVPASQVLALDFQNIQTAHLESPFDTTRAGGNKTVVYSFAAISILVLLIGCINFTILTTAKATQRAREVAMRKVVGAKRKQLVLQFLGESYFIVVLAMFLSLGLVELFLPLFEGLVGESLAVDYASPWTYLSLVALLVVVGLSGGLYPAFVLSGFRPGGILKANQSAETRGSMALRHVLVIFQFTVSIVLIIATGVIYAQLQYSMNRDPGFNKENLLVINQLGQRPELRDRVETLKDEILSLAGVSSAALSDVQPSQQQQSYRVYTIVGGERAGTGYTIAQAGVDFGYFSTYQIPLIAGREFSMERDQSEPILDVFNLELGGANAQLALLERNIVINTSAVRELGYAGAEDAIGKIINSTTTNNINYTVIGVVADNQIFSINAEPRAEIYVLQPEQANVLSVRFQGDPQRILEQVGSIWREVMGDATLSTAFVDQLMAAEFQQERTEVRILISFAVLAIIIACLGLYGSASFTVDRRVKEIGLRKVMGAKVKHIVTLLLWQFSKPVLIANIIAWPVAIYVMRQWLQRFPYQIDFWLFGPLCLAAAFIALAIAWVTVASNTSRVARSNPILALRYE